MQGEVAATAVAEQLVAQEADETAKAAARKAKKQKAKARKQQARLVLTAQCSMDPTAASEPSAAPSMQSEQGLEQTVTLAHSSPAASTGGGSSSDQDAVDLQSQLQHTAAQDTAVHNPLEHVALDELRSASGAMIGSPAGSTSSAAVDASRGADAIFLDQLFCCPITKVILPL